MQGHVEARVASLAYVIRTPLVINSPKSALRTRQFKSWRYNLFKEKERIMSYSYREYAGFHRNFPEFVVDSLKLDVWR